MKATDTIITYTLSSGLRCVHEFLPDTNVEYAGLYINAGSRDDPDGFDGLAHFVEHTIFKGTSQYTSNRIINTMELCGGELNAYTTKEHTALYSLFPEGNLRKAVNLIASLALDSQFPEPELDKERDVVCDEIDSYLDMPSEAIYDDFETRLFAGTALSHNILGSAITVSKIDSSACRKFLREYYRADNMVFFYSGPSRPEAVLKLLECEFQALSPSHTTASRRQFESSSEPFRVIQTLSGLHQSHVVAGCITHNMHSPQRHALALMTNILGGPGMNSMLNVSLREKRGLVYTVEASTSLYTDTGAFTIYFGCDKADVGRCLKLVDKALLKLASVPMAERSFNRLKNQYLGQMVVAADNRESSIMSRARALLYYGNILPMDKIRENILSLSPSDLQDTAAAILQTQLSTLIFE